MGQLNPANYSDLSIATGAATEGGKAHKPGPRGYILPIPFYSPIA